mgnify:CR=1 FL=1
MQSQEHPPSYYAASRNDPTAYPQLQGTLSADVCVIGGGFSGISTAITLAERGASVVLLEARRIGYGASGRNGGQVNGGMQGDARLVRHLGAAGRELVRSLWYRGHEIIEERIARFGIACDWRHGHIEAAVKEKHLDAQKAWLEVFAAEHPEHRLRLMSKAEISEALGTDRYVGGIYDARNAHCHPLNLCLGEARGAASLGVRIFERSPVTAIRHGSRPEVVTETGSVTAGQVVLAGNAYHHLEQQRLAGLLHPAGTYVISTEPLPEAVAKRINGLDAAVSDSRVVLDYYRLSADRRLLFGGLCNYSNRVPRSIEASLRPKMLALWPELADTRIAYAWGGPIGIVLSRVPLIGRSASNVYYLQGYSGHGVNVTHIAGEIVADAIAGAPERLELFERMPQTRLPGSPWLANQILALGMAYYRVRDLL